MPAITILHCTLASDCCSTLGVRSCILRGHNYLTGKVPSVSGDLTMVY